jgi:hypothetical protein
MSKKSHKRKSGPATERVRDLPPEAEDVLGEPENVELEDAAAASPLTTLAPPGRLKKVEFIRPSQLREMIATHCAGTGIDPAKVDPFRFVLEHGLPNPTKAYRVVARKGTRQTKPVDIDHAVDESDAIRQAMIKLGIKQSHQWTFRCLCTEE